MPSLHAAEITVGAGGSFLFDPRWEQTFVLKGELSGGVGLFTDFKVWDYIAIGAMFDFYLWMPPDVYGGDMIKTMNLDPSFKAFYRFGNECQYEAYGKLAVGYTAFMTPKKIEPKREPGFRHGWNIKILAGFQIQFGLAIWFIEGGWAKASYKNNGTLELTDEYGTTTISSDYSLELSSFLINSGMGIRF